VSGQLYALATLHRGSSPGYPLHRRLGGLQAVWTLWRQVVLYKGMISCYIYIIVTFISNALSYAARRDPRNQVTEQSAGMTRWIRNGFNQLFSGFICRNIYLMEGVEYKK
jgi:hypothetical protein